MSVFFYVYVLFMIAFIEIMNYSFHNFFERRCERVIFDILSLTVNAISVTFIFWGVSSFIRSVLLIILLFINVFARYKMSSLTALTISMVYIVSTYSVRGIIFPLIALATSQPLVAVMVHKDSYYIVQCLALVITTATLLLLRKHLVKDDDFRLFISHPFQLRTYLGWLFVSWILMMVINTGRYRNIEATWYSLTYFTTASLIALSLVYFYYYLNKITVYSEKEMVERRIIESLESKLELYKRLEDQLMSIRRFRHDYRKVLHTLKYYSENEDNEGMAQFIRDTLEVVDVPIDAGMQYSNNFLLDAMLQDISNRAEKNNIRFEAQVFFPEGFEISDLDIVRLFGNAVENSLNHTLNVEDGWIKILGKESNHWFHLSISNSFDGLIKKNKGAIITRKKDSHDHGYGLFIMNDIVERLNGVITYSDNETHDVFTVKISIPLI